MHTFRNAALRRRARSPQTFHQFDMHPHAAAHFATASYPQAVLYRLLPADQRHCCAVCAGASGWITNVEHGFGDAMWDVHCLGGDAPSQVRAWQWLIAHSGVRSFSQAAQLGWAAVRISTEDTCLLS